ncbi:MAG: electron transport complex subunit RsxC [Buchnera aphidicola (Aphis urticata)]|uniref:Ion-translocating oxidoreductase complex subunit C n=1 Tax=Buchnera aphidicola (Aphis urticata) TaxID=2708353 RepID=A0AAJ4GCI5_9GAMM|nr:MAG: electron transport complex subunit RsxC [Buchnera aphidicola (Aphis urticata)]
MKKKYNFSGGVTCLPIKEKPNNYIINHMPIPKKFIIYVKYNTLKNSMLRIKINQKVLCGQPLTFGDSSSVPIHSPTSGLVQSIEFNSSHVDVNKENIKITILSDYLDQWIRLKKIDNYKLYSAKSLIKIIYQLGIVGLGGAHFSSAKKLTLSVKKVHTLVVNAVESDPYITADYCLINNYLNEIFIGCKIVAWISQVKNILIVIQEDKIELISKIQLLIQNKALFKICILKKKYPGGSSKIIIKSLTGKEIPFGKHSIDIGYLIFNISTVYAIKRAIINGEPLIQRIVSLYNYKNHLSKNFLMRIGTPINFFLNYLKIKNNLDYMIYIGGVFMNNLLTDLNYAISKDINCITIYKKKHKKSINYSCINCSYCVQVCPVNLLPQKLYLYAKNKNHKQTKNSYIMDCIECKICEKVCPSNIPLVKYFKNEKIIQNKINVETKQKKIFFRRFQLREERLLNQKKMFYENNNYFNTTKLIESNILKKTLKKEFINKNQIEKNIRKEILRSIIERAQYKK